MMKLTLVITIVLYSIAINAQKKVISTDSFNKWPTLSFKSISPDGKYVAYVIRNNVNGIDSLIIQSINNEWKIYAINARSPLFSDDSKRLFYTSVNNQVIAQYVGDERKYTIESIDAIRSQTPIQRWLLGSKTNEPSTLIVYNVETRKEYAYENVKNIYYTDKEDILIVERTHSKNLTNRVSLEKLDFTRKAISIIWQGNTLSSFVVNDVKDMIAFIGEDTQSKSVFSYDVKNNHLKSVFVQNAFGKNGGLSLERIRGFNGKNGLFLQLSKKPLLNYSNDSVRLNIWSYTDKKLQSLQLSELDRPDDYMLYIDFKSRRHLQVSWGDELITPINDKCVLVSRNNDTISLPSVGIPNTYFYLQFLHDGQRIKVPGALYNDVKVSPDGRFLMYYNAKEKCYYSYELASNTLKNITENIETEWSGNYEGLPRGIAGWDPKNNVVFIYDRFDIWKLNLRSSKDPINITNGYGRKNSIVFARTISDEDRSIISDRTEILLLAFNKKTKDNGFFWASTSKQQSPRLASMGPYIYDISKFGRGIGIVEPRSNMLPLKASKSDKYIVQRSSATDHFNLFSTSDFKNFEQLSHLQPQEQFNWYTSELYTWRSLNSDSVQGILYKPENFDANKKYPLIYIVYDDKSDGLNSYWIPGFAWNGIINIPYFVSQGYLVFAPDFMLKPGEIGENLLDVTLSSIEYLKKFQFIDSARIGINGFSFGGFETYYLITNTNKFAAAAAGGGVTNLISEFGRIEGGRADQLRGSQTLLRGYTPWNSKKFIEYNPIFKVNHLETPVLMLHNKDDDAVNFSQAIEFYAAARSLGKRTWLLEYEGQGHAVEGAAAYDFTLRLMQFFDHYLKGKPAPLWMLGGRPARLRGINDRLQLDTLDRTPQFH